jgi:superfamily II DNA or RNA helicase
MQETNRPTIIITLKPVVKQWISTITSVLGDNISGEISTDGLNPKKWTVLYYDNFSKGKNLEDIVKKLSNENFGIAILDELHKVKHGKATWSKNIAKVVANIPTRWGASATVSSNKPMDVKNQLKITGHHLGDVEEKKFKRDFAGENDNYDQSGRDSEEKKIAAAERLNRWLNLSGVYVRRSKSDVREMPNISVGHEKTQINQDQFDSKYKTKLSGYKNPNLPVSKLIAARETVAQLKTDDTTKKVIQTVTNGLKQDNPAASKVVVFTNFVESGNQLVYKISEALKNINPSFYVLTYMSDTKKKERTAVKGKFTDDANAKVLIMSMKMGGTGIDFPNAAQSMIINDFDWTPESAEQSEGRIYRINTNHPVDIKYVVSSGIDSKLFEKVQQKRKIANIIQQYRKDYQDSEHDQESLNKIVQKQKELKKIDDEMIDIINSELPGAGEAIKESFKDFIANDQILREELLYGFSRGFSMPNISEWREKHVRDYKHVKQGFVAGNPRYSDKKIDSKNPKKSRNLAKKIDAKE